MEENQTITNLGELYGALAQAQSEFLPIEKKTTNPFYKSKYADLAEIRSATTSALSKYGLAVVQIIVPDDNYVIIDTLLCYKNGTSIKSQIKLSPVKTDPQGIGSTITYARRYSLAALLGVAAEDDDDANAGSGKEEKKEKITNPKVEIKRLVDWGLQNGFESATRKWIEDNIPDGKVIDNLSDSDCFILIAKINKDSQTFKKDTK